MFAFVKALSVVILTISCGYSAAITQILGYADTEYVVENITIRIPPSLVA